MTGRSFEEAQSQFAHATPISFEGQVRRFGPHGPAYEVVGNRTAGEVEILVIESGERLIYSVGELLADPIAETVP